MSSVRPVELLKYAIENHASKEYLDEYFGADTSSFKFEYSRLEQSEIEAGNLLIGLLNPKRIIRIPEVKIPERIKTPDFEIDGIKYEIKAPNSLEKIQDRVKEGKAQIKPGGFLVLSTYNCRSKEDRFLREAIRSARGYRLNGFYFVARRGIKYISIKK